MRERILALNDDYNQKRAIGHTDGPMLVIAGPGSGKTRVIVQRVRHLVFEKHVTPERILVITFTRAAALEMKSRFEKAACAGGLQRAPAAFGEDSVPVVFGTFHAVFFQILRTELKLTAKNIVSERQKKKFLKAHIERMDPEGGSGFLADAAVTAISRAKNNVGSCGEERDFEKIYAAYEEFLSANRLIDFDDMAIMCRELFMKNKVVLSRWRLRFEYILIDEFQDINPIQYDIVKLLAAPKNNIFIVGDDDQAIYGFRGADPGIMKRFAEDFPGAERVVLSVNYRSRRGIVEGAASLISNNKNRFEKTPEVSREDAPSGEAKEVAAGQATERDMRIISVPDDAAQHRLISDAIKRRRAEGVPHGDMAVLLRTNREAGGTGDALTKEGIPCAFRGMRPGVYGTRAAKDIAAYIAAACGDRSRRTFLRIMNAPGREILRESLPPEPISAAAWKDYYAGDKVMRERIEKLLRDIDVIRNLSPCAAVGFIRAGIGYERYIKSESGTVEEQKLSLGALGRIAADAEKFKDIQKYNEFMRSRTERAGAGDGGADAEADKASGAGAAGKDITDAVRVMTIHAAKGLEFDTVFIADVCEGSIPDYSAESEAQIEEERRLMYVAMTRAKNRLYIVVPGQVRGRKKRPSKFIYELNSDEIDAKLI